MKKLIGIEIGGSHTRVAVFSGTGKSLSLRKKKTPSGKTGMAALLRQAIAAVPAKDLLGVGIAAPGLISGTRIIKCTNLPYLRGMDFKELLERRLAVRNDAWAFAASEKWARPRSGKILALTFGTGIGRAYARNKEIKFWMAESWEKKYQKIRFPKERSRMAAFLAGYIAPFAAELQPDTVAVSGGVGLRPGFIKLLRRVLQEHNVKSAVRKRALPEYGPAWGACLPLLVKRRTFL